MPGADEFQLSENRKFQERFWRVERWGWGCFALIILAGLMGLTGSGGPFARQEVAAADNRIDQPRVMRWHSADRITLQFAPAASAERKVLFSREFGEAISIQDARPRPARWEATAAGQELTFLVRAGEPAEATLLIKGEAPGIVNAVVSVDGAPAGTRIIVLP